MEWCKLVRSCTHPIALVPFSSLLGGRTGDLMGRVRRAAAESRKVSWVNLAPCLARRCRNNLISVPTSQIIHKVPAAVLCFAMQKP